MALVLGAWLLLVGSAGAEPLPVDLRAGFVLRTLAYDRALEARAGNDLGLLVLGGPGDEDAREMADNLRQAVGKITVSGLDLRLAVAQWSGPEELVRTLAAEKISVVYVAAGLEPKLARIAAAAAPSRAILIAHDGKSLPNGASLGFTMVSGRPVIVIDRKRAEEVGMKPDKRLLDAARVVD